MLENNNNDDMCDNIKLTYQALTDKSQKFPLSIDDDYGEDASSLLLSFDNDVVSLLVNKYGGSLESSQLESSNKLKSPKLPSSKSNSKGGSSYISPSADRTILETGTGIDMNERAMTRREADRIAAEKLRIYNSVVFGDPLCPSRQEGYLDPFSFADDDDLDIYEDDESQAIRECVWEIISEIKDPEFNRTLQMLGVVRERGVQVYIDGDGRRCLLLTFKPTVPHCSQATTIALSLYKAVTDIYGRSMKIRIQLSDGSHLQSADIEKQVNDKERTCAALEIDVIKEILNDLLKGVS